MVQRTSEGEGFNGMEGEGFNGAEGEGFSGVFTPKISSVVIPADGKLTKGTVLKLNGENFGQGIEVKIAGTGCSVITVVNTSLTCSLIDTIEKVEEVIVTNQWGEQSQEKPEVLVEETDSDGDSISDNSDNCTGSWNQDQEDSDQDGIGDACDPDQMDSDGDGLSDSSDNCPELSNPEQTDSNSNGVGDACDDPDDFNPGQEELNPEESE